MISTQIQKEIHNDKNFIFDEKHKNEKYINIMNYT